MNIKQTAAGWWVVEQDSHISAWVEESGRLDHAPWLAEMACAHVPEGGIIIDAGAMLGDHTLTYSNKVGPTGKVWAFEPGALAFQCLILNAGKFVNDNVTVCPYALSNQCNQKLFLNENVNLGMSHCVQDALGTIQTTTVDDLALSRLDLLKIDCEGMEFKILQGSLATITRCKPHILLELNSEALKVQGATYDDIYRFLADQGYTWEICQPQCNVVDPQYDILAKPKN